MSEAKRENSQYRHTAVPVSPASRSGRRAVPESAATVPLLRLVDPREAAAAEGADPYNAVGARLARNPRQRA